MSKKKFDPFEQLEKAAEAAAKGEVLDPDVPREPVGFLERYLPFPLSPAWRAFVRALYGLPLEEGDPEALQVVCGFTEPKEGGYLEGEVVAGRRSGKSVDIAGIGVFEAVVRGPDHMRYLAPGQRGYVVVLSKTQRQALEVFRYARATVERNPELQKLLECPPLESQTGGELRFKSGVTLSVFPASKSSVRGFTVVGAILDECAWWANDDQSADQDEEIASAIRFGMLAPTGAPPRRLLMISSPAAKSGVVYDTWARYYGNPDAPVLVAHGPTWVWNPSIDRATLAAEETRNPTKYAREVLAEFADAISAWCDSQAIDAAAAGRDDKPLPAGKHRYVAAVDLAFKRDASVLAIGHLEQLAPSVRKVLTDELTGAKVPVFNKPDRRFVVDGVWRWTPRPGAPLDSRRVVEEMSDVLASYGVRQVLGDQFCIVPLAAEFKRHGVQLTELTATNPSKLENFTQLKEALYGGFASLPADPVALKELRELQERISSTGSVQIGHPNRESAHDDHACAIAWCYAAARKAGRSRVTTSSPTFLDY